MYKTKDGMRNLTSTEQIAACKALEKWCRYDGENQETTCMFFNRGSMPWEAVYGVEEKDVDDYYGWREMHREWLDEGHGWPFFVVRGIAYESDEVNGGWVASFDPTTIEQTGKGWQPAEWWKDGGGHPRIWEIQLEQLDDPEPVYTDVYTTDEACSFIECDFEGWWQVTVESCGRNGMPERREVSVDLGIDPEFIDFEGHVYISGRDGYDAVYAAVWDDCGEGEWPSLRFFGHEPAEED